jgi:hypothetical protein
LAYGSNDQTSHIAVFPEEISDRIVLATTDEDDTVLDPFSGSGTVCKVAKSRGRHFLGFEISPHYHTESVHRISRQAKGELLSVLSEILKEHVFNPGETKRQSAIVQKAKAVLWPLSLKPYESLIAEPFMKALSDGREDAVKKPDKLSLWRELEQILPLRDSCEKGKDPAGLLSIVDRAYARAYKLQKVYSSAMRFHCVAKWINSLRNAIGQDENKGWRQILKSLVQSEPGTYHLDKNKISIIADTDKAARVRLEATSQKTIRREPIHGTLF